MTLNEAKSAAAEEIDSDVDECTFEVSKNVVTNALQIRAFNEDQGYSSLYEYQE